MLYTVSKYKQYFTEDNRALEGSGMKQHRSGRLEANVRWDALWGIFMSLIVEYQDCKCPMGWWMYIFEGLS